MRKKQKSSDNPCELIRVQEYQDPSPAGSGQDEKGSSGGCCRRLPSLWAEAVMFLYMFSYVMRGTTTTAMIVEKVCSVHLGYPDAVCSDLRANQTLKSEVVRLANNYALGQSLVQMLPSSLVALFVGSWSDRYGRKPPMVLALAGVIADGLGSTACAYFLHTRVEFCYISAAFTGLSGGFIGVMAVLYSYASDTSTPENRTLKYALMQVAFGMSMPLGALAGGWIFKFFGFVPVFAASASGHLLGLIVVLFCLPETRGLEAREPWAAKFRSFWSLEGVRSSVRATAKRRPDRGRAQVWLLILAMSVIVLSYASLSSVHFLFVHHQFDWDNTTFSTVQSVYTGIGFVLMMIIVPIFKRLNVADPALGIMGSVSLMLKYVGTGLANVTWLYHVAMAAGVFSSLSVLASRSRISKVIPKDDLGKVFAFVSTAESLLPIAATAAVSQAFNASLDLLPGLVFLVMGVLMIVPLAVFIWVALLPAIETQGSNRGNQKSHEPSTTKL